MHFEGYYPEPLNVWMECRCFPAEEGLSVYFHDITERKRTETALQESNDRFHLLADGMPQLVWMTRPDGYVYWYNRRWFEYTGTTLEQMQGWGWQAVHDPIQLPTVLERWKLSVDTGTPFEMTFSLRGRDGILRPFLTRGFPLKDASGKVLQWFGTCTDVSELEAAEKMFRKTFENAAIGIAHVDPHGRWLRVNEVLCELIGYDREELFARTTVEVTHPDDLPIERALAERLHDNEADSYTLEKRCIRKDGSTVWVNVTVSCARAPNGGLEYFIALVEDISERKAQQAALERSEARLRRLFESNVVGMILWNLDSSLILDANEEFYRMTGYSPEDVAARLVNFRALTPPEWTERNELGIRTLREQGVAAPYENRIHPQGWVSGRYYHCRNSVRRLSFRGYLISDRHLGP
ncbi:MAG: PAS domain S-box protein [Armatimonas sp.]